MDTPFKNFIRNPAERSRIMLDETTEHAFIAFDTAGTIVDWNRGAERITGFTKEAVLGKSIEIIFTEEDRVFGFPNREIEMAYLEGKSEDRRWHQGANGRRFWADGLVTPVRSDQGEVLGFTKIFRDHTLQKTTEDDLRRSNAELKTFAYVAAHDLETPLRTVTTYLTLAKRALKEIGVAVADENLDLAHQASVKMSRLIKDLLDNARLERRALTTLDDVDLNSIIDIVIANLRPEITLKSAVVARASMPLIKGNAIQLERLFQNLVSNSLKYCPAGRVCRISIDVKESKNFWLFSVRDNGDGIAPENTESIFQMFERVSNDGPEKDDEGGEKISIAGLGLGLAICKKIVENHRGRIWVESTLGQGAAFFVELPMVVEDCSD